MSRSNRDALVSSGTTIPSPNPPQNSSNLRRSQTQQLTSNSTNNIPSYSGIGMLIGAKPGSIVERHIGSTLGDVVRLSPLQTGILRRFLSNGFVEFLLGNNVVKLEPGYELRVNETIAIRRRQELNTRVIHGQEVRIKDVVILLQILANLICKDEEYSTKLRNLYTVNNNIIKAGCVMAIYPEGVVLSGNFNTPEDVSSWIFLGDKDLNDIKVLPNNLFNESDITSIIDKEWRRLEKLLSLDAGMKVTFGSNDPNPKIIESIWWNKGNVLGRKAIFDNGRASVSILSLRPHEKTLSRATYDSPPSDRSYLRLYTEFQNPEGLLFSICGYDDHGVIANFKPPPPSSGISSDSCGRCWVPFSYFDNSQLNENSLPPSATPIPSTPSPLSSSSSLKSSQSISLRASQNSVSTQQNFPSITREAPLPSSSLSQSSSAPSANPINSQPSPAPSSTPSSTPPPGAQPFLSGPLAQSLQTISQLSAQAFSQNSTPLPSPVNAQPSSSQYVPIAPAPQATAAAMASNPPAPIPLPIPQSLPNLPSTPSPSTQSLSPGSIKNAAQIPTPSSPTGSGQIPQLKHVPPKIPQIVSTKSSNLGKRQRYDSERIGAGNNSDSNGKKHAPVISNFEDKLTKPQ